VTTLAQLLAADPWVAVAVVFSGFLALLAGLEICVRYTGIEPETSRKLLHTGSGALTLSFPFLFHELWPVLLLTGAGALLMFGIKFLPALRTQLGGVANRVERVTFGEVYFPLSVALLFWLTRESHVLLFVIPVLMLTLADATGAMIGHRYGMTRYFGASKSLEGSIAFVIVAFLCVHVPLLLWSDTGRAECLLTAATLGLLVMLLEGSSGRGLDNVLIPIGGYFLLRFYLSLDATALLLHLLVTVALVALLLLARRRTTLADDALVASAFLCYVVWAVMGWAWLVAPVAIAIGYRWLSPPTRDNSLRIHDVSTVLSVCAPAIIWLAFAGARRNESLLLPYTIVFGAHLAMFGTSRLGCQYPDTPVAQLFTRSIITSWAIVTVPYVLLTGIALPNLGAALGMMGAIALGTAAFVALEPDVRDAALSTRRWACQAAAAGLASLVGWAIASVISSGGAG
jgi:phytol kinase